MFEIIWDDNLKFIDKEIVQIKMNKETCDNIKPLEVSKDFDVEKMGYVKIFDGVKIEIDDDLEFGVVQIIERQKYTR